MPVEMQEQAADKLIEVRLSGTLVKADYERFVPAVTSLITKSGKIRMLVIMHDFHGWTAGAFWEDIKFDAQHMRDITRLALVGETRWQKGLSVFCKPFTTACIRYFTPDQVDEAQRWLRDDDGRCGGGCTASGNATDLA